MPEPGAALRDAPESTNDARPDMPTTVICTGFGSGQVKAARSRRAIRGSPAWPSCATGIQATTWSEIAAKAGVPVETVEALFPTLDELARSCGQHLMESLALAPRDRAPEVLARASSEHERIHRLVETFFGAYERGVDGITAGRRERKDVPAVDESMEVLDDTFDALVVEALRPLRPDSSWVASLRRSSTSSCGEPCGTRAPRPRPRWTRRARRSSAGSSHDGHTDGGDPCGAGQRTRVRADVLVVSS